MTEKQVGPVSGAPGWNMYVFRDGRQAVSGMALRSQLADALRAVPVSAASPNNSASNEVIEALLRAGELECALADAQHPAEQQLACITDGLAAHLVADPSAPSPASLLAHLPATVPQTVHISPPEGFAYYALHPLGMAIAAADAPSRAYHVAIIGIRTIGVTLSAVVAAELRKRGKHARRITVRPDGHPYDRRTIFNDNQKPFLCQYRNANADFLIADEGPGMSGSSFLSVADALVANRVPRDRITLLCSRHPDVSQLRARDAQERWTQHRALYVRPNSFLPADAKVYIGAGLWREHLLAAGAQWPESWLHMERLKFLSPDKRTLFKFEGFGRYGRAVHERAQQMHEAGYGPECGTPENGFGIYPITQGRLLQTEDLSRELLSQMARYCAMRAREFRTSNGHTPRQMEQMACFNAEEEFAGEPGLRVELPEGTLACDAPVVADARMQPHEWLMTSDGRLLKLDGAEHGDDHFFPGPTDIAWDLAGAIIEWQMNEEAQDVFLHEYRRASGDHAQVRIEPFLLAYASFRMGYCKMAAEAVRGSGEENRLLRAYQRYREHLVRLLKLHRPVLQAAAVATEDTRLGVLEGGASPEPLAA